MSLNEINPYDLDAHIAEIYDRLENYTDDVELIVRLIGSRRRLRILEPFCGTGRILIPLALKGHHVVGLDAARGMLARARAKIRTLPDKVRKRLQLRLMDAAAPGWPPGFDVVILGNNCLNELATPSEQETCIRSAGEALKPGGYVYVDNDPMEGDLDESWQEAEPALAFPTGLCADGTYLESSLQTVWFDAPGRLARLRRMTRIRFPDGTTAEKEYLQQKHPVSAGEVQGWLESHGFAVEIRYGDHAGNPYTDTADRAIFWARKAGKNE